MLLALRRLPAELPPHHVIRLKKYSAKTALEAVRLLSKDILEEAREEVMAFLLKSSDDDESCSSPSLPPVGSWMETPEQVKILI